MAGGGGRGPECPPETSDREIFADVSGKKSQGEKGKGVKIEKKRQKIVKGKLEILEMEVGKVIKRGEDLFFFFFFSLLKMTEICFNGSTKMGNFYREKAFHVGKNFRKNDFAPSEKYACYTLGNRDHGGITSVV